MFSSLCFPLHLFDSILTPAIPEGMNLLTLLSERRRGEIDESWVESVKAVNSIQGCVDVIALIASAQQHRLMVQCFGEARESKGTRGSALYWNVLSTSVIASAAFEPLDNFSRTERRLPP